MLMEIVVLVKMTVRVPTNPLRFRKWLGSLRQDICMNVSDQRFFNLKIMDAFVSKHDIVARATVDHPGFINSIIIDADPLVYSCTVWKNLDVFSDFTTKNKKILDEMIKARENFLRFCNLRVIEPIFFQIENLDMITLDLVSSKYQNYKLVEQIL